MKKLILLIMAIAAFAALSACGGAAGTMNQDNRDVSAPSASAVTDVTGRWYVSEVIAPDGTPATAEEMAQLGAGYTLELLQGGVYLLYGDDGSALGQGQYSVSSGKVICTVGETEIVFDIEQSGTLRSRAEDGSVTVLSRKPEETPEAPDGSDVIDEDEPVDSDAPENSGIIEDDPNSLEEEADAPDDGGIIEDDQDNPENAQ
ncbi:MAG: hypothetical protein ACM3S4_04230 [Burkholderiales bacterium]